MHQHVDEPTRFRFGQKPSLIDLVISSKEELVSDITYLEPLGKSDHLCLSFNINTEPETINNSQQRTRMEKGDHTRLEYIIQSISWEENTKDVNIEETWDYFKYQHDKAVDMCIPKYTAKTTEWRRPFWMTGKAIKACKKKYWAWKRYRNTGRDEDYERYCRKRNLAQHLKRFRKTYC
ncbi:hypothetical protein LSH36_29g02092 [Paralvinella palmiformis]|uniref:Endonuclease/exonuclease/phosphatase domain-containing protein n=1 Tax=Paralvinella palmiformis TaxID=53620 RepID=A0AAD9KA04_9ANNE|nr:hypothetical protein LSH36_29g02092 [Paralvinella palmiformis]